MVDSARYKDWLDLGEKDLASANILFKYEGDYGIVAFHCQQAIEKYLKGYLLSENGELEKGHSLVALIRKVQNFDIDGKRFVKDCAYINQFYIETRYPAEELLVIEKNEAEECLKIVEIIREHIYKKMQQRENENLRKKGDIVAEQIEKMKAKLPKKQEHDLTR